MALIPLLVLALIAFHPASAGETPAHDVEARLGRSGFPAGFIFGTSSAAYQYEGAAREGGRGPSIWDTFTHEHPDEIADGSNGDVADDFYHRYKEDVNLMKDLGTDAFRFSISWSRILPNGSLSGGINKEGIRFYNNLIDELLSKGLKPFVTIFHFDTPEALEEKYGGFQSPLIVEDFREFANICFREFGDRVKHWITINEPSIFSTMLMPTIDAASPRACDQTLPNCTTGNFGREPYIVGHYMLLAHAAAVKLYRNKYQATQKGIIGITLASGWALPLSNSKADVDAVQRYIDFSFGWFMDPLTYGDYPLIMRALVGDRLPRFTAEQSKLVIGSFDFIGINYYTSTYVYSVPISNSAQKSYNTDSATNTTDFRNGIPIGQVAGSSWLYIYPRGIRDLLEYTKEKYNNPIIYITENGVDEVNNESLPLKEALKDPQRIYYYKYHLLNLQKAIRNGVDVRGYFAWSLLDDFEWLSGYTIRFGIYYVDYKNGLKRYPKQSAHWFKEFFRR